MAGQKKTQTDLADVLGLSQSAASRRLNGQVAIDLGELAVIADWLALPLAELLGYRAAVVFEEFRTTAPSTTDQARTKRPAPAQPAPARAPSSSDSDAA